MAEMMTVQLKWTFAEVPKGSMNDLMEEKFDQAQKRIEAQFKAEDQKFDAIFEELKENRKDHQKIMDRIDEKFDTIVRMLDRDSKKTTDLDAEVASVHARIDRIEGHRGLVV